MKRFEKCSKDVGALYIHGMTLPGISIFFSDVAKGGQ